MPRLETTTLTHAALPKAFNATEIATIADILRPTETLPTEDASMLDTMRAAFIAELKPSSPYQAVLVSHLVDAERDIQHIRGVRTGLLRDAMSKFAEEIFSDAFAFPRKGWGDQTIALMDPYSEGHKQAVSDLLDFGITLNDLASRAYKDCSTHIQALDRELDRAHRRRQTLRAQYDALARAETRVEDAEVLEA